MKLRFLAFLMAAILCFSCMAFVGCDKTQSDETTGAEENTTAADSLNDETTQAADDETTASDETDAPDPEVQDEGYDGSAVTIVFYHTMGQNLRDVLEAYIVEFNKLYPNITIEHSQVGGYDDVRNQISTEITVGNQPNIAYCYPDHVATYNISKAVYPLDALIANMAEVTRADGTTERMGLTQKQINDFIAPIDAALQAAGFRFEIKKRVKTPYSIWNKMMTKGVSFDQIFDLYAVRIIFDPVSNNETERDMCYHVFSIITGMYKYKSDRVRDWVNAPKNNGYEALHCTLMSQAGIWIEVQIRSRRMNDIAEKGIAAHWSYKKDGFADESESEMDKWITKVKDILVNPDINALELLDLIHNDLLQTEIFVFTPKGEQKSIEKGATALDFAYAIHTQI